MSFGTWWWLLNEHTWDTLVHALPLTGMFRTGRPQTWHYRKSATPVSPAPYLSTYSRTVVVACVSWSDGKGRRSSTLFHHARFRGGSSASRRDYYSQASQHKVTLKSRTYTLSGIAEDTETLAPGNNHPVVITLGKLDYRTECSYSALFRTAMIRRLVPALSPWQGEQRCFPTERDTHRAMRLISFRCANLSVRAFR